MKVLVYFRQEFYTIGEECLRTVETVAKVFDAYSNADLLQKFDAWDYVPLHVRRQSRSASRPFTSGKKTMLWYLPESGSPNIKDDPKNSEDEVHAVFNL